MDVTKLLPKLIRAGFENDKKLLESITLTLIRSLKSSDPKISEELSSILSYSKIGQSTFRSVEVYKSPVDSDSGLGLVTVEDVHQHLDPVLDENIESMLETFIQERERANDLIRLGIRPTNTILLCGKPGVGKTMTAKWIASKLDKPLMTIDLAASISSFLGTTGKNLKKALDYAREHNSILFLDEFDAIAKRRDDDSDVGELKRIVNVLLKELEDWPVNSVVIAATNHPEILDRAVWRRFERHITIPLPEVNLRREIIRREFGNMITITDLEVDLLAEFSNGQSPSSICTFSNNIKKEHIVSGKSILESIVTELKRQNLISGKKEKQTLVEIINNMHPNYTQRDIAKITGFSKTSIQGYLR